MSEYAQEQLEHAAEQHAHGSVSHAKRAGVIIAAMAACLAIGETAGKNAQTAVLTHHINASNTWAQYQSKSTRRAILNGTAEVLSSLPGASDEAVAKRIAEARTQAARMQSEPGRDGMEQLATVAHEQEHQRDHEEHRHHGLEIASGGLQVAIVLVSVSVVTNLPIFLAAGSVLGGVAVAHGLLVQVGAL